MDNVIPLFPCGCCGKPAARLTIAQEGIDVASGLACATCIEQAEEFLVGERKIFEMLLAAGVSREAANVMMVAKHQFERK